MKSVLSVLFSALVVIGSCFSAHAEAITNELDGQYTYLAPGENYKITRFEFTVQNGKISFEGPQDSLKNIQIESGAQDDFAQTLKNPVPQGISFYKIAVDLQGAGEKTLVTLVKQTMSNDSPRLSLYAIAEGRPTALMRGYAADQQQALENEEKKLGQ